MTQGPETTTPAARAAGVVSRYYAAFNASDTKSLLALLTDDVVHDISQGARETGLEAFARFLRHMDRCYRETLTDIVVMTNPAGTRAACEFVVHGTYLHTDPGVPEGAAPARGQSYVLPAGAFLEIRGEQIARVSNHYSLADWLAQIA